LTFLESGHLAGDPDPFEVGESALRFTEDRHLAAEVGQAALGAEDRAEDQGIDVLGVLKVHQYPFAPAGDGGAQGLSQIFSGLRVCLALPCDNTHPLPHARSVEPCVHMRSAFPRGRIP
jgi:hypothetical protein